MISCLKARLDEFSLIIILDDGKTFQMHRLVQLAMITWLEKRRGSEKWRKEALILLSGVALDGEYEN